MSVVQSAFLDYMLPPSPLLDLVRYLLGMLGVAVFCAGLVQWLRHLAVWGPVGFAAVGIATALQQFDALGSGFAPWRLPLLLIANVCGIVYLYRLGGPDGVASR